jgi:hypothetical protein
MADSVYCTRADIANVVPPGQLRNPARLVAEVQPATDLLVLDGHAFALNTALVFRAEEGGSMPAPLVAGVTYYAIPVSDSTFQVAATPGGLAVDITTAGDLVIVTSPLPWDAAIEWASAVVDDHLGVHRTQLATAPYPESVVSATATLAAWRLAQRTGHTSQSLKDAYADTRALLDGWSKGRPLRGPNVPASSNLAVTALAVATDPRGWTPRDGGLP